MSEVLLQALSLDEWLPNAASAVHRKNIRPKHSKVKFAGAVTLWNIFWRLGGEGERVIAIVPFGYPVLREVARPVEAFDKKLGRLLDRMVKVLDSRRDGAALAAPQLSALQRVVVMDYQGEFLVLVNPQILSAEGREVDFEGCLSLPGLSGRVPRFAKVRVRYQDGEGKTCEIEREGAIARCLQHEIDHLDGILYIDRMEEELLHANDGSRTMAREEVLRTAGKPPVALSLAPVARSTRRAGG